mmetsp:Transcript_4634/g.6377  ORF Transcript_4634/g.6377 Transcript_4634/m.6377 type:complete len:145 (+) Transcript_4634:28-462(+)
MAGILFEDIFDVRQLNPEGKKFIRVNRIYCKGMTYEMDLILDINCEIYNLKEGEKISVVLAKTLNIDGSLDDGSYRTDDEPTLLDNYEYAMHGVVYRYEHEDNHQVAIYASFGGLLMRLIGNQRHLASIEIDQRIYILIRKTTA